MRKIQKFGAALIVAAVIASAMSATRVYASDGVTAAQKSALCAAIESTEAQLTASTNVFVKRYLSALLAGLEKLEVLVGGCAS
ncbi:MAG: hypothetical protein JWL71_1669 [Acidobacteria bacterium]|nr:hypothetical protein [Acidobacteriota bacterium]